MVGCDICLHRKKNHTCTNTEHLRYNIVRTSFPSCLVNCSIQSPPKPNTPSFPLQCPC